MEKSNLRAKIEGLISQGETEEALSVFRRHCQNINDHTLLKRSTIISSNFISAKKSWQDGTATLKEFQLVQARTNEAILDLVEVTKGRPRKRYVALIVVAVLAVFSGGIFHIVSGNKSIDSYPLLTDTTGYVFRDAGADTISGIYRTKKAEPRGAALSPGSRIKKNTFSIDPAYGKQIIQLIERETGYGYDKNSDKIITFTYSGEISPTNTDKTLFKYSGGILLIRINEKPCQGSSSFRLERTLPSGNSLDFVKSEILNQINNILEGDSTAIVNSIKLCID